MRTYVGGLEISVHYVIRMEEVYCGGELAKERLHLRGKERFGHVFLEGPQVVLYEFHD